MSETVKSTRKTHEYKRGEIICREGEYGHSMYVLLQGTVEVTLNSYSNDAKSIITLQKGSFFGEMSLLEKKPRSATVSTKSDNVIVLEISEQDFPSLLIEDTGIAYKLLLTLNKRLNNMLNQIEEDNKKYVYLYRKNPTYTAIQNLTEKGFEAIAHENSSYVWTLLKYLSSSLSELNTKYLQNPIH